MSSSSSIVNGKRYVPGVGWRKVTKSSSSSGSGAKFPVKRKNPFDDAPFYAPGKKVGEGGFGQVYKQPYLFEDGKPGIVALKQIENKDQAVHEVEILEQISPRHKCYKYVPCLYDYFKYDGKYYIVEEFIDGQMLRDVIKGECKNVTKKKKLTIMRETLTAIKYLHSRGIYHNDLKPENIMYNVKDESIVIDFGMSCSSKEEDSNLKCDTDQGGTKRYFSPQRYFLFKNYALVGDVDKIYERGDIYALGVVFIELFGCNRNFSYAFDDYISWLGRLWENRNKVDVNDYLKTSFAGLCQATDFIFNGKLLYLLDIMTSFKFDTPSASRCLAMLELISFPSSQSK